MGNIGRILVGIVQRAVGYVRSIEFRNMNLHPPVLRKAVDNVSGGLQVLKPLLCIRERSIAIMPHILRQLRCVMVPGDKIQGDLPLPAELQKFADPQCILHTADCRPAYPETRIHFLDSPESLLKQSEIFIHVGILPESRQIRLIPDFHRPGHHFVFSITFHKVTQRSRCHITPGGITCRRRGIPLPIEYGLIAGCHFIRHKSQLQERLQAAFPITVHHKIKIGKIILRLLRAVLRFIFLIDGHIVRKKAMAPISLWTSLNCS